jgi:hypothetical protein
MKRVYEVKRYVGYPPGGVATSPVGVRGAGKAQALAIAIALAQGCVRAVVKLLHWVGVRLVVASVRLGAWPRPDGAEDRDVVGE